MACATQTFSNVTAAVWQCLCEKAAAANFPITGPNGSQSAKGVTISWAYDAAAATLAVTCTAKPFFVSCGSINAEIHHIFDGTGCGSAVTTKLDGAPSS